MKFSLPIILSLLLTVETYSQTKEQTISSINSLLSNSIGGIDSLVFGDFGQLGVLKENSIKVNKRGLVSHRVVFDFGNGITEDYSNNSYVQEWKFSLGQGRKHYLKYYSSNVVYRKKLVEMHTIGDRFYYVQKDEERLLFLMRHLKSFYPKKNMY